MRRAALICVTLVFTSFGLPAAAQQTAPESSQQSVPPALPPDLRGAPASGAPSHRWVNTGGYLTPAPRHTSSTQKAPKRKPAAEPTRSKRAHQAAKPEGRAGKSLTKSELRHCNNLSRRQLQRDDKCKAALQTGKKPVSKSLTKAELRRCKGLSKRQLRQDSKCKVALQEEKKPVVQKAPPALSKADQRRCKKMSYQQLLRNADCAGLLQRELQAGKQTKHRSGSGKSAAKHHKAALTQDKRHQKTSRHRRS